MPDQNLILNMVTFNHPVEVKQFGLFRDEFGGSMRLHKSVWPVGFIEMLIKPEKCNVLELNITLIVYFKKKIAIGYRHC